MQCLIIALKYGTLMFETMEKAADPSAFEAALAKAATDGKDELAKLRSDPDVQKFLELGEPLTAANVINKVTENIDRVALLARIKLKRHLSPISTGNPTLLDADPSEKSLDELEKLSQASASDSLKRFISLMDAAADATVAASRDRMLAMGPRQYMPGLEEELIALCIPAGR